MASSRLVDRWPHVRDRHDGTVRVWGWYLVQERFAGLRVVGARLIGLLGLGCVGLGSLPAFARLGEAIGDGGVYWRLLAACSALRWDIARAVERPGWMAADLRAGYSATLILGGLTLGVLAPILALVLARLLVHLAPFLLTRRFSVLVGPDRVRVSGALWRRSYLRRDGSQVQFSTDQETVRRRRRTGACPRVCMRYGYRQVLVARDLDPDLARQASAALNYARDLVDNRDELSPSAGAGRSNPMWTEGR
jgi:hypothetical protein